ncbi:PNK3P-domain-containing protein [Backusella circina FSU 941]|nr:PNK3P-domain-containing protein [Backusella circina FSU 941]
MKKEKTMKWKLNIPSVLIGHARGAQPSRPKIAAFDLDDTFIKTKSGRVYAKNKDDWCYWDGSISKRLEELYNDGFSIVIFSNQNGLKSEQRIHEFQYKVESIINGIDVPVTVLAAMDKDHYRKPMTGMWDWIEQKASDEAVTIDKKQSFFVGDAAGRQANWKPKKKKDHSCSDRKFAFNSGIGFFTPEEYFLNEKPASFSWGDFDPKEYKWETPKSPILPTNTHEIIVCVGIPASGKSSYVKQHLISKGYVHVNQDTLRTKEKCVAVCKQALKESKSVVIDNTNPEKTTRAVYIKLARDANVPIRCFYFGDNDGLAQHNNFYRAIYKQADEKRELIGGIVFRLFKSKFQAPTKDEGFDEIEKIDFSFDGSEDDYKAWLKWWN